jgi:hypothetical protein
MIEGKQLSFVCFTNKKKMKNKNYKFLRDFSKNLINNEKIPIKANINDGLKKSFQISNYVQAGNFFQYRCVIVTFRNISN